MLQPILTEFSQRQRSTYVSHMEYGILDLVLGNGESDPVFSRFRHHIVTILLV